MSERPNTNRLLVGKPEGNSQLRRSGHRKVYNIKMELREIEWGGVDWIDQGQDRDRWRALVGLHKMLGSCSEAA
jgi:hypothetical protein